MAAPRQVKLCFPSRRNALFQKGIEINKHAWKTLRRLAAGSPERQRKNTRAENELFGIRKKDPGTSKMMLWLREYALLVKIQVRKKRGPGDMKNKEKGQLGATRAAASGGPGRAPGCQMSVSSRRNARFKTEMCVLPRREAILGIFRRPQTAAEIDCTPLGKPWGPPAEQPYPN